MPQEGVANSWRRESTEMVEIRPGISVDKAFLERAKQSCDFKASHFFRKLMFEGGVFTLEEIAECSLTGKPSGSIKKHLVRKCIDLTRYNALKAYTVETFDLKVGTSEWQSFEKKILNIPGDARRKLNRIQERQEQQYTKEIN